MHYTDGGESPIQVVIEVPDHDSLRDLLRTIQASDIDSKTRTISLATISAAGSVTVNLDVLTEKQRETLELALSEGYYERPREADLTTLADQLGISKSAVSQRIRNAETNLITNALDAYR